MLEAANQLCKNAWVLDWQDLRFFLEIARSGTLSAAAKRLKVDQSTVSRRLQTLESEANARLFDRTPGGYLLTAAGEAVRADAEQMEQSVYALERKLLGSDARVAGNVRVATSDSLSAWFVLPRLAAFLAEHPDVCVEFVNGNQGVNLANREADVSLRLSKPTQPNLLARRIGSAAWAVYAAKSYLKRHKQVKQLSEHDFIGFDEELRGTVGARWMQEHVPQARKVLTTNTLLSQAAAVAFGLGVSPLPCIWGDVQPGIVRLLPDSIGSHDIWLVVHPDAKQSARVRVVMDALTSMVEAESSLLNGLTSAL
jgi:DNA-binding transcriptional LysR family regulator